MSWLLHHASPAPRLIARTLVDDVDIAAVRGQFPVLRRLLEVYDQVPKGAGPADLSDPRVAVVATAAMALGSATWAEHLRPALGLGERDGIESTIADLARLLLAAPVLAAAEGGRRDPRRDRCRHEPVPDCWALGVVGGMCPGQRKSAGKRGSARTRQGSKWLRTALIESARRAARLRGTYLAERYLQVCRRRGDKKAIVAVGHEILIAAHRVLSTGEPYDDPGPDTLRNLSVEHVKRHAVAQLRSLGFDVTLETAA